MLQKVLLQVVVLVGSVPLAAQAQGSLPHPPTKEDSAMAAPQFANPKVDSINKRFAHRTDSLQKAYSSPMEALRSKISRLNHKKDSLTKLHLPTPLVTHKIDSLEKAQAKKLTELNAKIQKTKHEALSGIASLHLPPQAQNEVNALTKNINGFSLPDNFFRVKGFGMSGMGFKMAGTPNMPSLSLPSNLSIPNTNIPSLQKLGMGQLPALSKLQAPLGNLGQLKPTNMQALEKAITNGLAQNAEAKSLTGQASQATAMEKKLSKLKGAKSADSLARQQLVPLVDHFAGKEKELQSAMGTVSKYKQEYSNVKSLAELPKRAPNPLKDRPWMERLVPGLNYFIQSKHHTLVDFNPNIGWRFNPKLTASIGWNERVGISKGSFQTNMYDRVYGVRSSVSYLWAHGFVLRLSPEAMSAHIPAGGTTDQKRQALVWGLFAGVRKDFKIFKNLIGYSEGVYNFTQKPGHNIYGDRLSFRMGMELKLKEKTKKANKK